MAKNIIIGVGNLLFCDDGIGVIASQYLRTNYSFFPELEILDGGTLGFGLIEYFTQYDNVFILDTLSLNDSIGSMYKIPAQVLLAQGGYKNTAHEVEVVAMLEAASLSDKRAEVTVFGIVPSDIETVCIGLSASLEKQFLPFIELVLEGVKSLNIDVNSKSDKTLKEIISILDKG